jgi:hypothetical protein
MNKKLDNITPNDLSESNLPDLLAKYNDCLVRVERVSNKLVELHLEIANIKAVVNDKMSILLCNSAIFNDQYEHAFELSGRVSNVLSELSVATVADLVRLTETDLSSCLRFGKNSLKELKDALTKKGLRLGMLPKLTTQE